MGWAADAKKRLRIQKMKPDQKKWHTMQKINRKFDRKLR